MKYYVCDGPVCGPDLFVGRQSVLRALHEGIAAQRSGAVFGGPSTGKTSLLKQLRYEMRAQWLQFRHAPKRVPVYIELRSATAHGIGLLMRRLWEATSDAILDPAARGPQPPPRLPAPNYQRAADPWALYLEQCESLWRGLRNTGGWGGYVLLLDDADSLLHEPYTDLLLRLVELPLSQAGHAPAAVVATGGPPLQGAIDSHDSPLHRLRPWSLGVLRDSDARRLVTRGLRGIDPDTVDRLLAASGKHPYVLQRLLVELWEQGPPGEFDAALFAADRDLASLFERTWGSLGQAASRSAQRPLIDAVLDIITGTDADLPIAALESELRLGSVRKAIDDLIAHGVAEQVLTHDTPHIRAAGTLWRQWYRKRMA